jgi:methylmalonyl-CoA mutase N-terminal domain/subunit
VGVNRFTSTDPVDIKTLQIDPGIERAQVDRLRQLRSSRSVGEWRAALDAVERAAASGDNLMPPLVAAVEAKATVGEISDTLRRQFGEYRESVV